MRAARCARIETCADRMTGAGVAMYRLPSPGPVCPDAKPAPDRASPHLRRLSRTLLQVGPARPRLRLSLSLPCQGLAVAAYPQVSGKRSQTLNFLGGNTKWLTRNPLMKSGSVASKLRYGAMAPMGTVYHSILREIGFKKNLSSRVVRTECARRNGWAGPGFGKKLSWSRENEVWLALSVREE